MNIIYFIATLLLLCQQTLGQVKNYNFINLNSKNGLSSNAVNAILKDKYGFMWFGTDDGLNKFDGQNFVVYRHSETDPYSIGRGVVTAIQEDKYGNLWIGSNITLSRYNRSLNNFTNFDFRKLGWIRSLCADHLGNIWIGTYSGLYYFNPTSKKLVAYKAKPLQATTLNSNVILCVFEDRRNQIWVGTNAGLHLFNATNGHFTRFLHKKENLSTISSNIIRSLAEDKTGNLWIGTGNGLNRMDLKHQTFTCVKGENSDIQKLSNQDIYKIAFDKDEKLWVGTEDGLNILHPQTGKFIRVDKLMSMQYSGVGSFVGHSVRDIYLDNNGIYWIGTRQGGVNKYDTNLAFFNHIRFNPPDINGFSASAVSSFVESPSGDIYIGTNENGLNIFNRNTKLIRQIPLGNKAIQSSISSLAYSEGKIWIGTPLYGIYEMNLATNTVKNINIPKSKNDNTAVPVNCLKVDKRNHVWIGTNGSGIYKYDIKNGTLAHFSDFSPRKNERNILANGYVSAIEEDQKGNLWFGSMGAGLAMYNPVLNILEPFNHDNSNLPLDIVQAVHCDKFGQIWVGVLGGGLCLYNNKLKTFHQYGIKQLLANDIIYKILEDDYGKLWVSTNKGISVFDPQHKVFKNYTYHNGIQQSNFNIGAGIKTSTGEMYFGGNEGFNFFNPKYLYQNRNIPSLIFTDLKIGNKSVKPSDNAEISESIATAKKIALSYKQNFSLDFVALNYTAPQESQYTYMLEGFDKEWNHVGSVTTAVYTNLDPGKYRFRLKAQSEDGSWNTPEKVVDIIVNPPFWRTYYAYFTYFLLLSVAFWAIRRRAIQKLRNEFALEQERLEIRHLIEKERTEAERKMELEQLKIKFLTNLSHELKTPLTLILNPIENLLMREKSVETVDTLNLINRNAKRLLNLVNQLMDFRKIEDNELKLNPIEGDLITVAKEIFDSFKYISARKQINLDFKSTINTYQTYFDKDKIERILLNLLSNALKFTNENGNVYFHIETDNNNGIKLIIGDSGIGLTNDALEKIFDRFYQVNNDANILNQGSGIGLSITQEFVKLHDGSIHVESQVGKGSIFTVFLPLKNIADSEYIYTTLLQEGVNETYTADKENPIESSELDKPLVLLVDDNEDIRAYLRESLRGTYRIVEASDGKEAWKKALSSHPEIIVSDINMPNMDGITLVKKIKKDSRTKHIPVILLTVLSDEINQIKGLETGASDYLTKPFSFQLLSIKINNLLNLNNTLKDTYSKQISIEVPEIAFASEDEMFLLKISQYVEEQINSPDLSITELSKKMNTSRGTLYNRILSLTGETPVEYIRSIKLKKAAILLEKSDMKISHIGYEVGFSNPNYFTRAFKAKYHVSPSQYILLKRDLSKKVYEVK